MRRLHRARSAPLLLAALLLAGTLGGCAVLERAGNDLQAASFDASPSATPSAPGTTGASPGPSATPGSSEPSEAPGAAASNPVAIPDPPSGTRHQVGEVVEVAGGRVVYEGLTPLDGRLVATFRLVSGSLDDARLLTHEGKMVSFSASGDRLRSAPFGSVDQPPRPDETLSLVVDLVIVPFEAGKLAG